MEDTFTIGTWNLDHWKQNELTRSRAWAKLTELGVSVALLQETVPPSDVGANRLVYRPIGGSRSWGTAVVAVDPTLTLREIQSVRTRYSGHLFTMIGTFPGAFVVGKVEVPGFGAVTLVSVYGIIDGCYAQTTMLRVVADLIPLFDSADGEYVILGGDFNVSTSCSPGTRERPRYEAILKAVESLGLKNLAVVVEDRPDSPENCGCGDNPCRHLRTYRASHEGAVGGQLDYLFATPSLVRRCRKIRAPDTETSGLSDHVPVVAEFSIADPLERTEWDVASFAKEMMTRLGETAVRVVRSCLSWAEEKQAALHAAGIVGARLDRFFILSGPNPELWFQLDLNGEKPVQYTVSLKVSGEVVVQFQYMRPPFETPESRLPLLRALNEIPGVNLPELRLNGRPTFSISSLSAPERINRFISILDKIVDDTLEYRKSLQGAGPE